MGGCLACCVNRDPSIFSKDQKKGSLRQGRTGKTRSISGDFWTTSTREMENSAVLSQGSMSSISISIVDTQGAGSANAASEFVNHGLLLWNQTRHQWVGEKVISPRQKQKVQEPKLSWDASNESMLGSNKPYPQQIPLSEMVDFLVEMWEHEGIYD